MASFQELSRSDVACSSLLESFVALVNLARVPDTAMLSDVEALHTQVAASKVVQTAETLMDTIDNLEKSALVGDVAVGNQNMDEYDVRLKQAREQVDGNVNAVADEARALLERCEKHLKASLASAKPAKPTREQAVNEAAKRAAETLMPQLAGKRAKRET
mmetsp:Transcript_5017/g.11411  ORF Transcript_5017/g.11411 Transcript_5017/m.11411 type:complete len:160 (-) Transcript_5017:66-545(-)